LTATLSLREETQTAGTEYRRKAALRLPKSPGERDWCAASVLHPRLRGTGVADIFFRGEQGYFPSGRSFIDLPDIPRVKGRGRCILHPPGKGAGVTPEGSGVEALQGVHLPPPHTGIFTPVPPIGGAPDIPRVKGRGRSVLHPPCKGTGVATPGGERRAGQVSAVISRTLLLLLPHSTIPRALLLLSPSSSISRTLLLLLPPSSIPRTLLLSSLFSSISRTLSLVLPSSSVSRALLLFWPSVSISRTLLLFPVYVPPLEQCARHPPCKGTRPQRPTPPR